MTLKDLRSGEAKQKINKKAVTEIIMKGNQVLHGDENESTIGEWIIQVDPPYFIVEKWPWVIYIIDVKIRWFKYLHISILAFLITFRCYFN